MVNEPSAELRQLDSIPALAERLVASRAEGSVPNDVVYASINLGHRDQHELASIDRTVCIEYSTPSTRDNVDILAFDRSGERPAELRCILDPPPRSQLFPVDQTKHPTVDYDVARLEIVVHEALVVRCWIGRQVVELANDTGQIIEEVRSKPPIIHVSAGQPRQNFLVAVLANEARRPCHAGIGETIEGLANKARVFSNRAPMRPLVLSHAPDRTGRPSAGPP